MMLVTPVVTLLLSFGVLSLSAFAPRALAQDGTREKNIEPIITDRPDFTESTEVVPLGMTQIEGGVTATRSGDERGVTLGEILVRQSLGPKTELRVEVPTFTRLRNGGERASGLEDGSIGFKRVLAPGSGEVGFKSPRVSLIGAANVPVGSREFRQSGFQPEAKLLLGVDLSERLALSSNLNYSYLKDESRFHEFSGSISLGIGISERVGSYLEVFGFFPSGGRDSSRFANGGFTYLLSDDFQLDARLGLGLSNNVDGADRFFGVGASRRF